MSAGGISWKDGGSSFGVPGTARAEAESSGLHYRTRPSAGLGLWAVHGMASGGLALGPGMKPQGKWSSIRRGRRHAAALVTLHSSDMLLAGLCCCWEDHVFNSLKGLVLVSPGWP